jgi:hypothetical protein
MGRNDHDNSRRFGPILAVAGMALCAWPSLAQHVGGATGHVSAGHVVATRPIALGRPMGTPVHSGQRVGAIHANSLGAASPPLPSWELPRTVTPHWEISPNIPIQPNAVQGNPIPRQRGGFGVGYVGLPYYVDPMAFVNADTGDQETDAAQQDAQPGTPSRPDYTSQAPYAEGPEAPYPEGPYSDQGYPQPPRAPYYPEAAYPPPPQDSPATQSAASQNNGLDHPALTLVFNDGRPPIQVHSYALTSSSVFVAESGHQRIIPVTDLDLPATIAQNREAGVNFELPGDKR